MIPYRIKKALAASIILALSVGSAHAQVATDTAATASRVNASSLKMSGGYARFIVTYRADAPTNTVAAGQNASAAMVRAVGLQGSLSVNRPSVSYKRHLATGAHLLATSRKLSATEAVAFMQSIASDPTVAYVEPDVEMHAADAVSSNTMFIPNDPDFAVYQANFLPGDGTPTAKNGVSNWGGANVTGAWQLSDGTGITIAILDTGIVRHADINTALGNAGYDFVSESYRSGRATDGRAPGGWDTGSWTKGAPYSVGPTACTTPDKADDSSWHGTHVASTAGAELTNNKLGLAGIAYNAKVLPVRVLGHCGGSLSDIADGLVWASGGHVDGVPDNAHPAQVINMSIGGGGACDARGAYAQAITQARANGSIIVVAAGNDNDDAAGYQPASCAGVITVGATGVGSGRAGYSNYNSPGESIVKLAAFGGGMYLDEAEDGDELLPEGFVWQAVNSGTTTPIPSPAGDIYGKMEGTSMAAPHVTGAIALMQSARLAAGLPLLTFDETLEILQRTARIPHTRPDPNKTFGAGILDAGAAVAAAVTPPPTAITLQNGIALTNQNGKAGSEAYYKIDVPANARALVMRTAGGKGDVSLYVKAGSQATGTSYDASSIHVGNAESVSVPRVATATTYYLRVVGVQDYSGLSVQATYTP